MSPKRRLIVVGNGMAGARLVEEVIARGGGDRHQITMFGDEPCGNYNRILLSSVLARSHDPKNIFINPLPWYEANGIRLHAGVPVRSIDLAAKRVAAEGGVVEDYDSLVIATGSKPYIPPIDGVTCGCPPQRRRNANGAPAFKRGVFVFRTLADCDRMLAFITRVSRAAVIGGGLLGLEAARGLLNAGLQVHVIHMMPHLMETQLDAPGGRVLQRQLEQMGIRVHLEKQTTAILGDEEVRGLVFADGSTLDCEMVVIAAGIRPNVDLAVRSGLRVGRGILVGDDLACEATADVYAIGECAEHRGRLYGLVAPLWEQAQVLADRLSGRNPRALYVGSKPSTKLKVAGVDLAVMGEKEAAEEDDEVVSYAEPTRGIYKKLVVRNSRLVGATVIGDGAIVPSLLRIYLEGEVVPDNRPDLLFRAASAPPPAPQAIPDTALICNCNGVTKAAIVESVLGGARSLRAVCDATRAGTGCGSCRPEVRAILELACQGLADPAVLEAPEDEAAEAPGAPPPGGDLVVTLNKIERIKSEKDGLDIVPEVPKLAEQGWERIDEGDRERLKWAGVFFRRQTPGRFMMRVRIANGITNAAELRTLAAITRQFGVGYCDITTRQQVQLRGFGIEHVPEIWKRLDAVGLVSLQTGMDNIRNVIGCPMAGLSRRELFDASPVAKAFTKMFVEDKAYTNLPRKFNVSITGCTENCTHSESQDVALTPAVRVVAGREVAGFNVAVGGKMGSGGYRAASPLDVFVLPDAAPELCCQITLIFRDHGSRAARTKARLAFLIDAWGPAKFRAELQRRTRTPLMPAGKDKRGPKSADHLGVVRQKQPGLNSVGLAVPVGRISDAELAELARLAEIYGTGDVRLTTSQNVIITNVPDEGLPALLAEPLLRLYQPDPPGVVRGLVSCTGIDYCHFALVETKALAVKTARYLEEVLPRNRLLTMHWSGCPAGCGNHTAADIGLLGKNVRVNGEIIEAVDVFVGGQSGANARPGTRILEDVPCDELPGMLERVIPYLPGTKRAARVTPDSSFPAAATAGGGSADTVPTADGSAEPSATTLS
jgi:nitrite reductase (NADH) large subunit